MKKIKTFLLTTFGTFGMILFCLFATALSVYPLIMFEMPGWLYTILTIVIVFIFSCVPLFLEILWTVGLFGAMSGPQDIFAYIYYAVYAIIVISLIINIIRFFSRR